MKAPKSGPRVLLRSEQTAAEVSVIESAAPPGFTGPPLHHHDFDETFYVIEGELTFRLRDELIRVPAGELVFAPRRVPHTVTNVRSSRAIAYSRSPAASRPGCERQTYGSKYFLPALPPTRLMNQPGVTPIGNSASASRMNSTSSPFENSAHALSPLTTTLSTVASAKDFWNPDGGRS
jgi:quercetin dioxygenase-like cupin family protein